MGLPGWWAIFWSVFGQTKKKKNMAVKRPQFSLLRPPRDVFWSPLSGKNRFGPGSTKKMTRPTSFSDQFSFFSSLLAPCDSLLPPFLALKWPRDPSKKIRAEISYPTMPVWRQETPWVRFYGQISEKNRTHFWLHHPGTPTTLSHGSFHWPIRLTPRFHWAKTYNWMRKTVGSKHKSWECSMPYPESIPW